MQNPFDSGHIKNYVLLYASVVIIMILFFVATSLFNEAQDIEKKVFNTEIKKNEESKGKLLEKKFIPEFKLMESSY